MKRSLAVGVTAMALALCGVGTAAAQPSGTSQNGYSIIPASQTDSWEVDGVKFNTRPGEATEILYEFTHWFAENIEPLHEKKDDWSWAPPRNIEGSSSVSNHASGMAIDINAEDHGFTIPNTFSASDQKKIRDKVAEYGGRLIWGGDWSRADDMHFEVKNLREPNRMATNWDSIDLGDGRSSVSDNSSRVSSQSTGRSRSSEVKSIELDDGTTVEVLIR